MDRSTDIYIFFHFREFFVSVLHVRFPSLFCFPLFSLFTILCLFCLFYLFVCPSLSPFFCRLSWKMAPIKRRRTPRATLLCTGRRGLAMMSLCACSVPTLPCRSLTAKTRRGEYTRGHAGHVCVFVILQASVSYSQACR